ncbi:MAG: 1,4-alpha-glucan branching protein GlgB [Clostridia bacterium]|nr:1,4-alpha-glucan branching protein GlgB [Clostridia bacterium]
MEKSKEIYLFHQGTYYHAYNLLGCHPENGGAWFRVWAPNAKEISVVGDFNAWDASQSKMKKIQNTGVWEVFVQSVKQFDNYKYQILTADDKTLFKADPYAVHSETNWGTASKVYELGDYEWTDKKYYENKAKENHYEKPMNVYEVNFVSWKKHEDDSLYTYRELADELIPYASEMGYTHIECMPLTEYPYEGSWGYQSTGYFAVTSRFGTPDDFRYFVNKCHAAGIGVILDWVPAHFPKDDHGLSEWDGSYLYENQGWDRMEFKEWGTRRFDYGRNEVQCFLISSATFFIDKYHIDGIRVDAVASMLYLDYDKKPGEWIPNEYGENKNLEAIEFLRKLNSVVLTEYPNAIMIAEESTAWPMVTKPGFIGGLGFNYKWNIGWMNDTLSYVSIDPFFRKDNHEKLTFSMFYAFSENFVLPISHDEVVYGKKSLLNKMYGDYNQKFDLMRTFMMYMFAHPGKKLTFMGTEFAQFDEWDNNKGIDFMLLDFEKHNKMHKFTKELNHMYLKNSEFYEIDYSWEGFRWLTADDREHNIVAFERKNKAGETIVCIANFSPVRREHYRVGVDAGRYEEIMNSNLSKYGGNGRHYGTIESYAVRVNGFENSIELTLEPNSAVYFKKKDLALFIKTNVKDIEDEEKRRSRPAIEAKNVVTKIIETKLSGRTEVESQPVEEQVEEKPEIPETNMVSEPEIKQEVQVVEKEVVKTEVVLTKRPKGRPRKPVDPNEALKPKRPKGRPRKPVDPNEALKPKRPKGRPRKPVDPNEALKPKRPKGRPRKPVDPNEALKPKRPKGRPRKETSVAQGV